MSNSIDHYFANLGNSPLLTKDEEVDLSKRMEQGDNRARDRMIESNLRLAVSIAKQYQRSGCSLEDLIQESNVGLIKAVDRFDWRKGFKFSTYASWWIKQAVRRYVTDQTSNVKISSHTLSNAFKASMAMRDYEAETGEKPDIGEIATAVGISVDEVREAMEANRARTALSLNMPLGPDGDKTLGDNIEFVSDVEVDDVIDQAKIAGIIENCVQRLTPRERRILKLRFGIHEEDK